MNQYLTEVIESPVFLKNLEETKVTFNQGENEEGIVLFTFVRGSAGQFKYETLFELFGEELEEKEDYDTCFAFLDTLTKEAKTVVDKKKLLIPFSLVVEEDSNDGDIVLKGYFQ